MMDILIKTDRRPVSGIRSMLFLIAAIFPNGRLPVHVRCLLDEFANIGQIPKFDKLIATIRSREISASDVYKRQPPSSIH